MKNIVVLGSIILALNACSSNTSDKQTNSISNKSEKPNILYILVDDLGYGDVNFGIEELSVFKNPYIKTPNLARLAHEGLVFTHHYASSPLCSPSRAGLLTGRTPTRHNINLWINDLIFNGDEYLRDEEITIAEKCVEEGYQTAMYGKWHLNCADWTIRENWKSGHGTFPNQQGFQHGMVSKENPHLTTQLRFNSQKFPGDFYSIHGDPVGTLKGYTSAILTDSTLAFLEKRDPGRPFFVYLAYDAVHERIFNPDEYDAMYDTGDPNKDAYYANVTYLDHQIGRLLAGLQKMNLEENTIVFFSSDNGPEVLRRYFGTWRSYGTSYPLNGQKRNIIEGGIRVPGIVKWTGYIKPGVSTAPNSTLDVMPTLCELINVDPPSDRELDGASLLNHLLYQKPIERNKPLYWQFEYSKTWFTTGEGYDRRNDGQRGEKEASNSNVVVRSGNYVLRGLYKEKFTAPEVFVLYDIVNDPEEKHELSAEKPEIFKDLKDQLLSIYKSANADRMAYENKSHIE